MSYHAIERTDRKGGTMLTLRSLRLTASFALLGATLAGVLLGWHNFPFDPRWIGAALGTIASIVALSARAV